MGEAAARGRKSIGAKRNPESADAIVEAAEAVLREAGYAGFSIEAVARRARAGKPTIYRWWPSKAALLIEVYQRQKRVETPDTGNVEDDLVGFLKNLFAHWRDTPSGNIFRSLVAEAQSDETAAAALAEYSKGRTRQGAWRGGGRCRCRDRRRPCRVLRLAASAEQSPR